MCGIHRGTDKYHWVIAEAVEVSLGEAGLGKHQAEFDSGAANKEDMVANVNRRYSGAEGNIR